MCVTGTCLLVYKISLTIHTQGTIKHKLENICYGVSNILRNIVCIVGRKTLYKYPGFYAKNLKV